MKRLLLLPVILMLSCGTPPWNGSGKIVSHSTVPAHNEHTEGYIIYVKSGNVNVPVIIPDSDRWIEERYYIDVVDKKLKKRQVWISKEVYDRCQDGFTIDVAKNECGLR